MSKRPVFIFLLCVIAVGAMAQSGVEKRIEQIRKAYASSREAMVMQPYDDVKVWQMTLSYNRIFPGTGLYSEQNTYYWTDDDNEEYMLKPELYFVSSRYSLCHDEYRFYREYLFDAETEEPMFMLVTTQRFDDESTRREYRFYFDGGRLIRQIPESIVLAENEAVTPDFIIDAAGRANVEALLSEFNRLKENFHNNVATYKW